MKMIIPKSLLIALLVSSGGGQIIVAVGPSTPPELNTLIFEERDWLRYGAETILLVSSANDFGSLASKLPAAKALFDVSFSPLGSETLASLCDEFETPQFVFGYVSKAPYHKWTFYVNGPQFEIAGQLAAVLDYFGWTKVNLVSDSNSQMSQIALLLKSAAQRTYTEIDVLTSDEEAIGRAVGRVMRMSGNRVSVFLTAADVTEKVVTAQYRKEIGEVGFGNVMPLASSLFGAYQSGVPSIDTGSVIIAEEELKDAASKMGYYDLLLSLASELCANFTDSIALLHSLNRRFPLHYREGTFAILNLQNGQRVLVGRIEQGKVTISDTVYFLGNSTAVPAHMKSPLQISANFGYGNIDYLELSVRYYYNGGMLAISDVNNSPTVLENFYLDLTNFTAGVSEWQYEYAYKNVYPYRNDLGVAVLAGISSGVTMNLIGLLRDLGYTGAVVGSSTTVNALSSRKSFPTFVRTILPDSYITRVYVQMFARFHWKVCGLFVSNETWGLGFQQDFTKLAQENGIRILNDPELQVLPTPIINQTDLEPYEANLINFIDTKCRVLIIVVNINAVVVVDYLYDLGLRGGDLQIVANEWMSYGYVQTDNPERNMKRRELLRGAIQFSPIGFVGKFGEKVQRGYELAYGEIPSIYACFFYDSALAIAYALDLIIQSGDDYTDAAHVLKHLRGSRFVGCTGTVTFDPDTNDRSPMPYDVLNAQFGDKDSDIKTVGRYDPTSTILFIFYSDIVWCDGTTTVPSDVRQSTIGCPFEDKFSKDFQKGRKVVYGVASGIASLALVSSLVAWKVWSRRKIKELTEAQEIELQDAICMVCVAVELLQYISIGPDLSFLLLPAMRLIAGSTLTLDDIISLKDGGFSLVWEAVTAALLLWLCMCIVAYTRLDVWLKAIPGCPSFSQLSAFLIPLFGNFLFLPVTSVLMDTFVCTEGLGLSDDISFTDSYLRKDCYLMCWQGKHALYAFGSSFGLVFFVPAVMLQRPMWEDRELALNVKSSALFLIVKTNVQVGLVLVKKVIGSRLAHCCVFIVAVAGFAAFSGKKTCFSYRRTAFWHKLSLVALLWSSLLALFLLSTQSAPSVLYLGLAISGWLLISLLGLLYQRLRIPSLLYRRPGVDPSVLFRFAFQRATSSVVGELNEGFKRVGSRCSISVVQSREKYLSGEGEEWEGRRNIVQVSRLHGEESRVEGEEGGRD